MVYPIAMIVQRQMAKQRRTNRESNTGSGTLVRVDQVGRKMTWRRKPQEARTRAKATQVEPLVKIA